MTANVSAVAVAGKIWSHPICFGFRRLFYAATPAETSFATLPEVPDYVGQSIPFFIAFLFLETVFHSLRGEPHRVPRWNDALSSMTAGMMSLIPLILVRNIEMSSAIWAFDHFKIFELQWNSAWTWWAAMLGVDFAYYWVHRFAHEVNFMWAAHQVHHSSEDYNLSTALRQSALQRYSSWIFYLPMAFFIPPSIIQVHLHFNLLYQFWIHTEVVDKLGPLEYILNTPSHHRVHHGRNRYCIDCNYGGTLIIWDRLFGTFKPETEEVVYGLVHPLSSWESLYTQFCHWMHILRMARRRKGVWNKLASFWKGPGWEPGKPRLGYITDIPDIHAPQPKYDKTCPMWATLYTWLHFLLATLANSLTQNNKQYLTFNQLAGMALFLLWTLSNIGFIMEHRWYAAALELLRCVVYLAVDSYMCSGAGVCSEWMYAVRVVYLASSCIWLLQSVRMFGSHDRKKVE